MSNTIEQFDLSMLPTEAQSELYDFYLFLKQKYQRTTITQNQDRRVKRLHELKVQSFTPLSRDKIYERSGVSRF